MRSVPPRALEDPLAAEAMEAATRRVVPIVRAVTDSNVRRFMWLLSVWMAESCGGPWPLRNRTLDSALCSHEWRKNAIRNANQQTEGARSASGVRRHGPGKDARARS